MKRLYVGCRVRVVAVSRHHNRNLIGREARIVGFNPLLGSPVLDFHPLWDGSDSINPDHIEPIQDPGHEVISWEEMRGLWTPEGVEA